MTVYEFLKVNETFLKYLCSNLPSLQLIGYLELYNDYLELKKRGEKVSYIVAILADKYNVTERLIYKITKQYNQRVNLK